MKEWAASKEAAFKRLCKDDKEILGPNTATATVVAVAAATAAATTAMLLMKLQLVPVVKKICKLKRC